MNVARYEMEAIATATGRGRHVRARTGSSRTMSADGTTPVAGKALAAGVAHYHRWDKGKGRDENRADARLQD